MKGSRVSLTVTDLGYVVDSGSVSREAVVGAKARVRKRETDPTRLPLLLPCVFFFSRRFLSLARSFFGRFYRRLERESGVSA